MAPMYRWVLSSFVLIALLTGIHVDITLATSRLDDPLPVTQLPNNQADDKPNQVISPLGEFYVDYLSYIGGGGMEDGTTLALDPMDQAYIVGNTASRDFPITDGAYDNTFNGGGTQWMGGDVGALKLNVDGASLAFGTYIGGSRNEYHTYFSDVDDQGNFYILGTTASPDFPTTNGVLSETHQGGDDVFVVKLDPSGQLVWSTLLGGRANEVGNGIVVDARGNVYVTGRTQSREFPTTLEAFDTEHDGQWELFVSKISPAGDALEYSTFFGGSDITPHGVGDIALDAEGNIYVTSYGSQGSFTITPGAYATEYNGGEMDVYVAKLDATGSNLIYGTYLGGEQADRPRNLVVASDGGVVIMGNTSSPDFPTTAGAFDQTFNGGSGVLWGGDMFLVKLNATGSELDFGTFLGSSEDDGGEFAGWLDGNLVILGSIGARELPITQDFSGSSGTMYLAILTPDASQLLYGAYLGVDGFGRAQLDSQGRIWVCGATSTENLPTTDNALLRTYQGGSRDGYLMRLVFQAGTVASSPSVSFINSGQSLGHGRSNSIGLGDLDADGDLDALVTNYHQPASVWLNDGQGKFTEMEQQIGSSRSAHGVALGDVDSDGDLDAFIAHMGRANEIWLNDGNGTFTNNGQRLGRANSNSVLLGDLDGDGDLDAVVENWPEANVIWLNDGSGLFSASQYPLGENEDNTLTLGDVDGDGDLDALVDTGMVNELWTNDGTGAFDRRPEISIVSGTTALADVDNDGDLDAFVTNAAEGNTVWLNDANGSFTNSGQVFGWRGQIVERPQPVALADVDNDGDLDAFTIHHELGNKLWLNDGNGFFVDSGLTFIDHSGYGISLGDADNDGNTDAFFANWEDLGNQIWLNETIAEPIVTSVSLNSPTHDTATMSDYLGQSPPGSTPEVFALNIISVIGRYEYGLAVSPDGDEIFFTAENPGDGLMVTRRIDDDTWTEPEVANLRGNNSWEFEAFFTPDGQELFFASNGSGGSKLWYVEKGLDGWGAAHYLESPANEFEVFWATFTSDDTMYYTNVDELKIYRARRVDGAYPDIEDIGLPNVSHPSVSPDESFLLFNSGRLGGFGGSDIFISFLQPDGSWSEPQNMGPEINTEHYESCPSLSPDGQYIFFSRYDEPDGKSNIYWVDANIIEQFREMK